MGTTFFFNLATYLFYLSGDDNFGGQKRIINKNRPAVWKELTRLSELENDVMMLIVLYISQLCGIFLFGCINPFSSRTLFFLISVFIFWFISYLLLSLLGFQNY